MVILKEYYLLVIVSELRFMICLVYTLNKEQFLKLFLFFTAENIIVFQRLVMETQSFNAFTNQLADCSTAKQLCICSSTTLEQKNHELYCLKEKFKFFTLIDRLLLLNCKSLKVNELLINNLVNILKTIAKSP